MITKFICKVCGKRCKAKSFNEIMDCGKLCRRCESLSVAERNAIVNKSNPKTYKPFAGGASSKVNSLPIARRKIKFSKRKDN